MTPQKQLFRHDPDAGLYGDCYRTCVACLLDLAPADVPHPYENGGKMTEPLKAFLAGRGLALFSVPFACKLEDIFTTMRACNPGTHYMLMGQSRTGCNHQVICLDDTIVHDPSLTDAGIIGPSDDGYFWIETLVQLSPVRQ